MKKIKFSHFYFKMPGRISLGLYHSILLQVVKVDYHELSAKFIDYDTSYSDGRTLQSYPLNKKGALLLLIILTEGKLWTTMRRWTPGKEVYYRGLMGQQIAIEIND